MSIFKKSSNKGFTLLEILLVVGIIAILAGIVIIAINPSKQLAQVRNTERKSDLKQIANAITQYYIDHNTYPTTVLGTLTEICDTGANASSSGLTTTCNSANLINLSELVPTYLTAIPKDPSATTTYHAGYSVVKTGNQIGLSAPAELEQTITIGTVPEVMAGCGDPTNPDCWSTAVPDLVWSTEYFVTSLNETTSAADDGAANTTALVAITGDKYPAAEYCDGLVEDGHFDWYLPAINQLTAGLEAYKTHFGSDPNWGGFAGGTSYWSSTESSDGPEGYAWYAGYNSVDDDVYSDFDGKDDASYQTRCIR